MTKTLVRNLPVAKFHYQGSHTHPIRRTVLVIESNTKFIKGYEVRCGNEVAEPNDDHIRSYSRSKIARLGDYSRLRNAKKNQGRSMDETTLTRLPMRDLRKGV
jgi:hypothetical protein